MIRREICKWKTLPIEPLALAAGWVGWPWGREVAPAKVQGNHRPWRQKSMQQVVWGGEAEPRLSGDRGLDLQGG